MRKRISLIMTMILVIGLFTPLSLAKAAVKPAYTISPSSKTYQKKMMNYSTYNNSTKHYYLLRSYLEELETKGGGTLVLKKGTYTISNTLYVPSNVTIKMKNGVKLVKGTKSGTSKFSASKSMFQLITPKKANKKGVYGKHSGEKNISFIGEGTVTIDMKYDKDAIAIIMGHNKNINVENIQFKNMYSGHFIEMDASENVLIYKNTFKDSKASTNHVKEAINIDTPDKTTNGWSQTWSKFDKTPNKDVTIDSNTFKNLDRAVGTHKYSGDKYHDKVRLKNNKIENTRNDAIRIMNWSNAVIENNTIKNVNGGKASLRGILASGALNPTIKNNTFEKVSRVAQFIVWKNSGPGSQYKETHNELSMKNKRDLMNNKAKNTVENFIRINNAYNEFVLYTEKIPVISISGTALSTGTASAFSLASIKYQMRSAVGGFAPSIPVD